jgi:hypothetical protein
MLCNMQVIARSAGNLHISSVPTILTHHCSLNDQVHVINSTSPMLYNSLFLILLFSCLVHEQNGLWINGRRIKHLNNGF